MDGSRPGSLTVAPASTGAVAPVAVPAPLARAVRVRVRIVTALAVGFLAVAVIAAGAFTITVLGAADTTQSLLLDRNRRMVEAEIEFVRGRLDPVARQLEFVAALAGRGRLDTGDPGQIMDALASMVEHMPQISGAGFGGGDGTLHRLQRGTSSGKLRRDSAPLAGVPGAVERFNDLRKAPATYWGELLWNPVQRQPVVNVRTPILREDGTFLGGLVATVTVGDFSRMVTDAEGGGGDANFILVARERVLAHRGLTAGGTFIRTEARPLPRIDEVGDPVMAAIWTTPVRNRAFDSALGGLGHVVEVQGRRWVFVFRGLDGYGPDRWLVGRYFPLEDATREVQRLMQGVWAGIAVLA
ncbi:MAG: cache domain-containing protein, partial [Rhodospirillales bacterium]|nr:cache domain-containing protein [Rhodospirillales bacterium]